MNGFATETEISLVDGITLDKKGNIYIAMREHNIISRNINTKSLINTMTSLVAENEKSIKELKVENKESYA